MERKRPILQHVRCIRINLHSNTARIRGTYIKRELNKCGSICIGNCPIACLENINWKVKIYDDFYCIYLFFNVRVFFICIDFWVYAIERSIFVFILSWRDLRFERFLPLLWEFKNVIDTFDAYFLVSNSQILFVFRSLSIILNLWINFLTI